MLRHQLRLVLFISSNCWSRKPTAHFQSKADCICPATRSNSAQPNWQLRWVELWDEMSTRRRPTADDCRRGSVDSSWQFQACLESVARIKTVRHCINSGGNKGYWIVGSFSSFGSFDLSLDPHNSSMSETEQEWFMDDKILSVAMKLSLFSSQELFFRWFFYFFILGANGILETVYSLFFAHWSIAYSWFHWRKLKTTFKAELVIVCSSSKTEQNSVTK